MKIFIDLDGTLFDSRRRLHKLFCDLTGEEALSEDEYWRHKRLPTSHEKLLEQTFGWAPEDIESFKRKWLQEIETEEYLALDSPYSFAGIALRRLAENADLYLLTARQFEDPVREQLQRSRLSGHFSAIIVTGGRRTKAQAVLESDVDVDSGDVLIGDTGADVLAARELNIAAVCVANGFREAAYLESYEPDCIYPDLLTFAEAYFPQERPAHPV